MTTDLSFAELAELDRRARARFHRRVSLVVLVVSALLAGLLLWRDLRDDRPHAEAGTTREATVPVPVQWRRSVLIPGHRFDVTAAVREDVTAEPEVHRFQAPDDGAFVGLDIDENDDAAPEVPDADGHGITPDEPQLTLIADGHRYLLTTDHSAESRPARNTTDLPLRGWLAVAGPGDRLVLKVAWQGHTQRVDLRSGKREAGDFAALYRQRVGTQAPMTSCGSATWTSGWRGGPGVPASCSYRADRVAWSSQRGWAAAGRQWVALTITTSSPSYPIHRVGARDLRYYTYGDTEDSSAKAQTPAESLDRLDGAGPVALTHDRGNADDETTVLVFDVARSSGAHTAVLTQRVQAYLRDESAPGPEEALVRQTWTVAVPG